MNLSLPYVSLVIRLIYCKLKDIFGMFYNKVYYIFYNEKPSNTKQIEFQDTMVYKDQKHKIQTTIFRKPTDQQTYSHTQSNHPKSLKSSILYSQALRIKTICSNTSEFNKNCDIITKRFKERGYCEILINEPIGKLKNMKRKQLLSAIKRTIQNRIPM